MKFYLICKFIFTSTFFCNEFGFGEIEELQREIFYYDIVLC